MSLTELKTWFLCWMYWKTWAKPGGADITMKLMLPVSLWAEIADEVTRPEQGSCVSAEGRQEDGRRFHVTFQSNEAHWNIHGGDVVGVSLQGPQGRLVINGTGVTYSVYIHTTRKDLRVKLCEAGSAAKSRHFALSSLLGASGRFPAARLRFVCSTSWPEQHAHSAVSGARLLLEPLRLLCKCAYGYVLANTITDTHARTHTPI